MTSVAGLAALQPHQLILDGTRLDLSINDSASIAIRRTISGASTVTITVRDRDHAIQRSGILDRAVDLKLPADDGTPLWFRLARDESDESGLLTLTFEARVWARLAGKDAPRSMDRDDVTAAQFLKALVDEVKVERIPFICRQLNVVQKIGAPETPDATTADEKADRSRSFGLADGASITVKGKPATTHQRTVIKGCLREANRLGASPFVMVAIVMTITQESVAGERTDKTGDDDTGIYQQGRPWVSLKGSKDPAASTQAFLISGPTAWQKVHGSIKTHAGNREALIKRVQGSVGGYAQWETEAKRTVAAFGADGGVPSKGDQDPDPADYMFRRGTATERETTTACGQRMATERNWRFFESGGAIYYESDEILMRSRPRMTIKPGDEHLITLPAHSRDVGDEVQQVTLTYRAHGWAAPPGSVVLLQGWGEAKDGRWLVEEMSKQDVRALNAAFTLTRGVRANLEPPPEETATTTGGGLGGFGGTAGVGGSAPAKIKAAYARAQAIDAKRQPYKWGGGHGSFNDPGGYDCSGAVSSVAHAAGFLSAPQTTVGLQNFGSPGRGKYMTIWVKENGNARRSHTFITFDLNQDGKLQFFEAGGSESGRTGFHQPRSFTGFVPRHAEGT